MGGGDRDEGPPRRGPTSDIGGPRPPPSIMGPGPGGRGPIVVPLPGIPTGEPGAPAPPLPPGPILGQPHPFMLPPPPRGYFRDWDRFGGLCSFLGSFTLTATNTNWVLLPPIVQWPKIQCFHTSWLHRFPNQPRNQRCYYRCQLVWIELNAYNSIIDKAKLLP